MPRVSANLGANANDVDQSQGESGRRILGWFPKRHSTFHVVSFSLLEV
jgi:hypothetical protein